MFCYLECTSSHSRRNSEIEAVFCYLCCRKTVLIMPALLMLILINTTYKNNAGVMRADLEI